MFANIYHGEKEIKKPNNLSWVSLSSLVALLVFSIGNVRIALTILHAEMQLYAHVRSELTFSNTWGKKLNKKIPTNRPSNTAPHRPKATLWLNGKETMLHQHRLLPLLQNSISSIQPELQLHFSRKKIRQANSLPKVLSSS